MIAMYNTVHAWHGSRLLPALVCLRTLAFSLCQQRPVAMRHVLA